MGNFCLRALAVAAALLVPALAAAQPAPSEKDKKKASEKVKAAITKSQAGDHEAAIALYEEAYKIIPQPLLLSNIGSEYQQMNKPVEALANFCKYLEADPNGGQASYVTAQAKTIYIELGGIQDVKDEDVCKPIVKPQPKVVPVETVVEKKPPPPPPPPKAKSSPLRWVGVGVAVVGAGVFGLGIKYGLDAKKISDDITNHDPNDPWPSNINQLESDGESAEKKQIAFMAGGGIALAAGVVLIVIGGPKKQAESTTSTSMSITPVINGDQMGFAAFGRF